MTYEEALEKARNETDALLAAERLLASHGYIVAFIHDGRSSPELRLAVARAIEAADKAPCPDCEEEEMDDPDVSDWGIFLADEAIKAFADATKR